MQVILAKNWWSLVIRGLGAILVGVITVIRNAISIDELALLFFVYALFDGIVGIAGAARASCRSAPAPRRGTRAWKDRASRPANGNEHITDAGVRGCEGSDAARFLRLKVALWIDSLLQELDGLFAE